MSSPSPFDLVRQCSYPGGPGCENATPNDPCCGQLVALPAHDHTIEPGEINRRGCPRCEFNRRQEQTVWAIARDLRVAIEQAGKRLAGAGLTVDEAGELLSESVAMAEWSDHFDA